MKTKLFYTAAFIAVFFSVFLSCTKDKDLTPATYTLDLSDAQAVGPMITLGRILFYDQHLSVNNSISCASCHKQSLAFSDNVAFSPGFDHQPTLRNAIAIQNIFEGGGMVRLFWDGRENVLGTMVLKPIVNHVEMGMSNLDALVARVQAQGYYDELFTKAFADNKITEERISEALSDFVASINSNNNRFDQFRAHKINLTNIEDEGRDLFFNKYNCNSCHQSQHPNAYGFGGGFVNIGLDDVYTDKGLGAFTHNVNDDGKFKIPSLRNIALTAPYMHDGRFATLDQVLEHYSHNIKNHPNLDSRLRDANNMAKQMNISSHEKEALIAFMNALTDFTLISDKKYSSPFIAH